MKQAVRIFATILFIFLFQSNTVMSQAGCVNDSMLFITNSIDWTLTSNSFGVPNNVPAFIAVPQLNTLPGLSSAQWINYQTSWTMNGIFNQPDDSAIFRYNFTTCQNDSITFDFLFRRDNYCTLMLDGSIIFTEPPTASNNNYFVGNNFLNTYYLAQGVHQFEIINYNTYPYTGSNGVGVIIGGYITSQLNSLVMNTPGCAGASCCITSMIVQVAGDSVLCQGENTSLTASGANTYSWSGGLVNGVSFTPAATTTYTVTGTDMGGCTATKAVTVIVNPNPLVIANATPQSVCLGQSTILSGVGATSYSWTGGINNAVSFFPSSAGTYTVTGTDANGCSNTSSISISILPNPTVSASATPPVLCLGVATILNGAGALSYTWTGGALDNVSFYPSSTNTYTVTGTDANGCTNTASIGVNVLPAPLVNAIASPSSVCQNAPTALTGSGALAYTWSGGITNGVPFIPGSTATYTVTGTDANGCTNTSTVTVNVGTNLFIGVVPDQPILCLGDSIQLTASGAVSYTWVPNININATTISNPIIYPASTATFTVTGTDATGCTGTSSVTIEVINDPKLLVSKSGDVECNIRTIQLSVSGANAYTWSPAIGLSAPNGAVTNAIVNEPTTFVVVGTIGTCIVTDSIHVDVYNNDETAMYIPNAFTPNGDGNNDCLRVLNTANFKEYYFAIYNRWGQRVFETDNPFDCWDGSFKNQRVESSTYYYFLKGETRCGKVFRKGDITVIY